MKTILPIILISVALNGCSSYQLSSMTKSATVNEVAPRTFTVNFCGNAYMSQEEVDKYALQRAAETALAKGYAHFIVLDKNDNSEYCSLDTQTPYGKKPSSEPMNASAYAFPPFMKPNVTLTVQYFSRGEKIPDKAIDAQEFLRKNFPGLSK